jgi:hypothetical protein
MSLALKRQCGGLLIRYTRILVAVDDRLSSLAMALFKMVKLDVDWVRLIKVVIIIQINLETPYDFNNNIDHSCPS